MGVLEEYQSASFRGVPFLVHMESEDAGQKSAIKEYPNSDERFVEQLGKIPSTFKMNGIVHGPHAIQERVRLRDALNTPGLGDLVHPIYGTVSVKALPFSVRSTQDRMGEFVFSLEFAVSKEAVPPSPDTPTTQAVTQASSDAAAATDAALEENYITPTKSTALDAVAEKVIAKTNEINAAINSATDLDIEELATLNRISNAVVGTAYKIAQSPVDLADSLSSIYRSALAVADTPSKLSNAWKKLLDNVEDITSPTNTVARANRVTNDNLLDEHARLNALANLYEAESDREYTTIDDLDQSQSLLEEKFTEYIETAVTVADNAGISSIVNDPSVRAAFISMRNTYNEVIKTKAQNLWRVVDIAPGRSSISLVAYKYYGDIDNIDVLKNLNKDVNVAGFNETSFQAVAK